MTELIDDLAKALAQGESRRRALRRFLIGVLGGVVAVLVPGNAQPAVGVSGPAACIRFCLTFKGRDRARCLQRAPSCTNGCAFDQNNFFCL